MPIDRYPLDGHAFGGTLIPQSRQSRSNRRKRIRNISGEIKTGLYETVSYTGCCQIPRIGLAKNSYDRIFKPGFTNSDSLLHSAEEFQKFRTLGFGQHV